MPNPENPINSFNLEAKPEIRPSETEEKILELEREVKQAQDQNLHVIIGGDYGGDVLTTIPAREIKCSAETLYQLAADLNQDSWAWDEDNDPTGTEGMLIYISSIDDENCGRVTGDAKLDSRTWIQPGLKKSFLKKVSIGKAKFKKQFLEKPKI